MSWYHFVSTAARALFRRGREDAELAEEMASHIRMEAELNERLGLSPADAHRRARKHFGSVERFADDARDQRGTRPIESFRQDARFGWRSLRRRPAFTALVVLTLGMGIGATTTLFAVVRTVLLAPLPYGRSDGIAVLWSAWRGFDQTWLSWDEYEAWDSEIRTLEDVALFTDGAANLTGGDSPERVRAASVMRNTFELLGVSPILGRTFTEEEDRPNGPRAVMLSFEVWQRRFSGDPAIVGRSIQLNGESVPVVGILPAGFRMPLDFGSTGATHVYEPLASDAAGEGAVPGPAFPPGGGGSHGFYSVARLAPGATIAGANAELEAFVARMVREGNFRKETQFRAFAVGVGDQVTGGIKPALLIVFGSVGFLLLIACANVAGLLLVRGDLRRRELAVRVALGAEGSRISRLLFVESGLLAALGSALGVGIAFAAARLIREFAPGSLPRIAETRIDPWILLFAVGVGTLAALLAGILPALHATRVAPVDELREGGRGASTGGSRLRWRQALVSTEVALAVVLVIAAGLMVRSVGKLFAIDPGFHTKGVLTMRLSTPSTWYDSNDRVSGFWDDAIRRVGGIPGVEAAGAALLLPLATEMGDWGLRVEGYTPPPNQGTPGDWQVVVPGYFEAMGLRLVAGRFLEPRDDARGSLAMVVNRAFVSKYLGGTLRLGTRVRIGGSPDSLRYSIVGVVDDVHHNALTREVKPQFYATLAQFAVAPGGARRSMSLVVRTGGDPRALITPVREVFRQIDPRLPISEVRTMDEVLRSSIAAPRFAMQVLGLFGAVALLLSAIGVFGVVSQVVASREQEFGIRAALGASPRQLVGLGLGSGLRQAAVGVAAGTVASLAATRLMTRLLQGVSPTDPLTFAAVVGVTASVVLLASALPARRASRAQPALVLRSD